MCLITSAFPDSAGAITSYRVCVPFLTLKGSEFKKQMCGPKGVDEKEDKLI